MVHRPVNKGWGMFDKEHKNFGYFMHIKGFCKLEHNMLVDQTESEGSQQFSPVSELSLTCSIKGLNPGRRRERLSHLPTEFNLFIGLGREGLGTGLLV